MISKRVRRFAVTKAIAEPSNLTYMSSVHAGCKAVGLDLVEGHLRPGKCAWRYIFVSGKFQEWAQKEMPAIVPRFEDDSSAPIQVEEEFSGFRYGYGLAFGTDARRLEPTDFSVWELKTPDVRIFGWFPAMNHFVAHMGEAKANLPDWDDYRPYVDEVVRFRNSLVGFLPTHVTGGMSNVVSNRPQSL
jgi:hypothetical protein